MLNELIDQTGNILERAKDLMQNPSISGVLGSAMSWLGDTLGKKSAVEKLTAVKKGEADKKTIPSLKSNLEFVLEDDENLQKQLAEKLKEIHEKMEQEGIPVVTKTNTMNISGDGNIGIQDFNASGNVNISN